MNSHLLSLYSVWENLTYNILSNSQQNSKKEYQMTYFTDKNSDPQEDYMIGGISLCLLTTSPSFFLLNKAIAGKGKETIMLPRIKFI